MGKEKKRHLHIKGRRRRKQPMTVWKLLKVSDLSNENLRRKAHA